MWPVWPYRSPTILKIEVNILSKIDKQGRSVLLRAFQNGKSLSRHEEKKKGNDHKLIFAEKSLENHLKNWTKFATWAESQGVKTMGKFSDELVTRFLVEQAEQGGRTGQGASKKTLESYLGSINKVMMASGRWEKSEKMELAKVDGLDVRRLRRSVYKPLNGQEWRERHGRAYERHRDTLDTIRAFGLREGELKELNRHSFLVDQGGKMYVQTIGKGGKYRVAEVANKELNERMLGLYGQYAKQVADPKSYNGQGRFESDRKNMALRLNLSGSNNHKIPKHIFRAEYAQKLLEAKLEASESVPRQWVGYSHLKADKSEYDRYEVKIGTYRGSAKAFLEVSQNLGHNRLDVLNKYL